MISIAITSYDIGNPPVFKNTGGFPHSSVNGYQNILNYLQANHVKEFNIIGGEPTIHADFDVFINLTNQYANKNPDTKINLYTTGYKLKDYIPLLGLNTNIILQWQEDSTKLIAIDKEIMASFKELYEKNYFIQKKAYVELTVGVIPTDYSFIFSLIQQYNIPMVQIRFSPLYEYFDTEDNYQKLKENFFKLCEQLNVKIIINPIDCIPWCQFTSEEKKILKSLHINYPVKNQDNIILYDFNRANSHILDQWYVSFSEKSLEDLKEINHTYQLNNCYEMCKNCVNKHCVKRGGRKI